MDLVTSIKESKLKLSRELGLWLIDTYKKVDPIGSNLRFLLEDFDKIECIFRISDAKYNIFSLLFGFESSTAFYSVTLTYNPLHDNQASMMGVHKTVKNQEYLNYLKDFSPECLSSFYSDIRLNASDEKFLSLIGSRYYEYFF